MGKLFLFSSDFGSIKAKQMPETTHVRKPSFLFVLSEHYLVGFVQLGSPKRILLQI